jgi:stage IV sporulation protein FB
MVQALSKSGSATPVIDVMEGDVPTVPGSARLSEALQHLNGRSAPAVGVVEWDGRLLGYVTAENIGELMMVENAGLGLRPRRATGPLLPQ